MKHTKTAQSPIVADICLYGTSRTGAGYIAALLDGTGQMFGTGEPAVGRGFTDALLHACDEVRGSVEDPRGHATVRVFAPGGERCAQTSLLNPDYFGDLVWETAPTYKIPVAYVLEHADEPS